MASKGTFALAALLVTGLMFKFNGSAHVGIMGSCAFMFLNLLLMWCYHAFVYPRYFSKVKHIPLASAVSRTLPRKSDTLHKWIQEPNSGLIRFLDGAHLEFVVPTSAVALQELLVTKCYEFEKPAFFKRGTTLATLGDGILFAEGSNHKRQRKQLNPAFAFRHVQDLVPLLWKTAALLARTLESECDAQTSTTVIEPNDWASRATLDALGISGLGLSFNAILDPDGMLAKAYRDLFAEDSRLDQLLMGLEMVTHPALITHLPLERNRKMKMNITLIRKTCRDIIREKRATAKAASTGEGPTADILTAIVSSREVSFTEDEMVEQLLTFLAAGHETTSAALSWAVYALCKHPEIQDRLRAEIWAHLDEAAWEPDGAPTVTAADLSKMSYLQAFCNEVLRVFPPIPMTIREAVKDTSLDGHYVPKGAYLIPMPWMVNVSSELWGNDALQFRPDRWLESPGGGCTSNYANVTFLAGPRSCIGSSFAKAELQCLVAAWVGKLETSFAKSGADWKEPVLSISFGISGKPTPGWEVEIKPAKRRF